MHNKKLKKAFTLVEVIAGVTILTIVALGIGTFFRMYASLIKDVTESGKHFLVANEALNHIVENIQQSAWVVLEDSNNIELHSQSYPNLRRYSLDEDGNLSYKEGDNEPVIICRNIDAPKDATTGATTPFKGVGLEKNGSRFNKIEIEFWDKDNPNDVFYAVATCKEDWGVIYVDAATRESGYEDGTKTFPYISLEGALNIALDYEYIYAGYRNIYFDRIIVLDGDFTLSPSEDIIIKNRNLVFSHKSTLTIEPGATLKLAQYAEMIIGGEVYCTGTPDNPITITVLTPRSGPEYYSQFDNIWGYIFITDARDRNDPDFHSDFQYNFQHLDISEADDGLFFEQRDYPMNVIVANSSAHECGDSAIYTKNLKTLSVNNIAFINNWCSMRINTKGRKYGGPQGTANYSIVNNTFQGGADYGNQGLSSAIQTDATQTVNLKIENNTFDNLFAPIFYDCYDFPGSPGIIKTEISNNIIKANRPGGENNAGIYSQHGLNSHSSSELLIKNNTIDGENVGEYGVCFGSYLSNITITNNEIANHTNVGLYFDSNTHTAVRVIGPRGTLTIKNNHIHDNPYAISSLTDPVYPYLYPDGMTTNIKNNIIYGGGRINCSPPRATATLENNTLDGVYIEGSTITSIKNCIIWGDGGGVSDDLKDDVTYSDVVGLTSGDNSNIIPPEDPLFDRLDPNKIYDLQDDSPCKTAGDDGTDMGAYGGPGNADWSDGVGVQ